MFYVFSERKRRSMIIGCLKTTIATFEKNSLNKRFLLLNLILEKLLSLISDPK